MFNRHVVLLVSSDGEEERDRKTGKACERTSPGAYSQSEQNRRGKADAYDGQRKYDSNAFATVRAGFNSVKTIDARENTLMGSWQCGHFIVTASRLSRFARSARVERHVEIAPSQDDKQSADQCRREPDPNQFGLNYLQAPLTKYPPQA